MKWETCRHWETFVFKNLKLEGIPIKQFTHALGWSNFFESLINTIEKSFVSSSTKPNFPDKVVVVTKLKGVEIRLTSDILAKILDLLTIGSYQKMRYSINSSFKGLQILCLHIWNFSQKYLIVLANILFSLIVAIMSLSLTMMPLSPITFSTATN